MAKRVISAIGADMLQRDGLAAEPAVWEDGLRTDGAPGTFEWWYFDAHLDDGSTVVAVYATKPLLQRTDPLAPMVSLAITRPDGVKLSALQTRPAAEFSAAREGCNVRVGPNWVRGDLHTYTLHAEGDGLAADLTFTGSVPAWRPGAGKSYYDEALTRYFAWLPAIPYGEVRGTLTYDGLTRAVQGSGYHDHNWGNTGIESVLTHWYWGRARVGAFTTIFAEMHANASYGRQKMPVFLLAHGEHILSREAGTLSVEEAEWETHPGGRRYPRRLDLHWQQDDGAVHLALSRPRLIETFTMLETLPAWKRTLARLLANPRYFRFTADLELRVDIAGVKAVEQGAGLYELMILR